jgi:hypothetical protein
MVIFEYTYVHTVIYFVRNEDYTHDPIYVYIYPDLYVYERERMYWLEYIRCYYYTVLIMMIIFYSYSMERGFMIYIVYMSYVKVINQAKKA